MIIRFIKWILSFLKGHKKEVIAGGIGIGAALGGVGVVNAHKAKKINKRALAIQQEALCRHDSEYSITQDVLESLGEAEHTALDSFEHFADSMAHIQGRPQMKFNIFSSVKLPNYEPEEIRCLSNNVQIALAGIGGAGAGALAGLAAFGAGALVAAPAAIGAGFVLCFKGVGLKKKAIENKRQAVKMSKDVDTIVAFYAKIREATISFHESFCAIYNKYDSYLRHVDATLMEKEQWKEFSRAERKNVENTVLLARLLYEMCKTNIVVRQSSEDKLDTINSTALMKLEKKAQKLLAEV